MTKIFERRYTWRVDCLHSFSLALVCNNVHRRRFSLKEGGIIHQWKFLEGAFSLIQPSLFLPTSTKDFDY